MYPSHTYPNISLDSKGRGYFERNMHEFAHRSSDVDMEEKQTRYNFQDPENSTNVFVGDAVVYSKRNNVFDVYAENDRLRKEIEELKKSKRQDQSSEAEEDFDLQDTVLENTRDGIMKPLKKITNGPEAERIYIDMDQLNNFLETDKNLDKMIKQKVKEKVKEIVKEKVKENDGKRKRDESDEETNDRPKKKKRVEKKEDKDGRFVIMGSGKPRCLAFVTRGRLNRCSMSCTDDSKFCRLHQNAEERVWDINNEKHVTNDVFETLTSKTNKRMYFPDDLKIQLFDEMSKCKRITTGSGLDDLDAVEEYYKNLK
jgi:hypothetical protein